MTLLVHVVTMNAAPKGIYVVAAVFFFSGLACIPELLSGILYAFGEHGQPLVSRPHYQWIVVCGLLLFWMLCYAVVALVRLRRSPQIVFFAITLFLTFRCLTEPAANSCLYSERQIIVHRILLLLPLIASCLYLLRLRFRAVPK